MMSISLAGDVLAATVHPAVGPFAGGNVVVVTNAVPDIGDGNDITSVTVGGVAAPSITGQGANWVAFIAPPTALEGVRDVVIESTSVGITMLAGAYTYNPTGAIGGTTFDWSRWQEVVGLPEVRNYLMAGSVGGKLYVAGGRNNSSPNVSSKVYSYTGSGWMEEATMPRAMADSGYAVFNDSLYIVGGATTNNVWSTNLVYRFNGTSWSSAATLPAPRAIMGVSVVGTNLYSVGGAHPFTSQTNVYRFNGSTWAEVAGLPTNRRALAAATLGTNVYAIGGYDSTFRTNVYRFGGTTWTQVRGLPRPVAYFSAVALGGHIYTVGGATTGFQNITNVYRFDGTNWTEGVGLPATRFSLGLTVHDGAIYAIGGSTGEDTPQTNVYRYPGLAFDEGVHPTFGSSTGGFEVTITGSNLGDGADITNVTLCGVSAASIVSQSSTQVVIMAGASGFGALGDVRVFSTSYGETVKSDSFTYIGEQVITNFLPADSSDISEDATAGLSATASSGLPVAFSIASGPGVISGGTNLSFTGAGSVQVVASQAGNEIWNPAPPLTNTYTARGLPVVGPVTLWRATNQVLKVSDLMLMTNAVDPSSSALTVTWVSAVSTNDGSVSVSGRWITYVPPEGDDSTDYFLFRVVNAYGGADESRAEVIVFTPSNEGQTMNIAGVAPSTSNTQVRFVGIPGRLYDVQATTNLVSTPWTKIGEATIGAQGFVIFIDTNEPAGQFYRTARPQ